MIPRTTSKYIEPERPVPGPGASGCEELVWRVQREAGMPAPDAALLAIRATLTTLAETLRLEADEPDVELLISGLAFQLPEQLREAIADGREGYPPEAVSSLPSPEACLAEFCRRVGLRTGVELAEAELLARAVAVSLEASIPGPELDRVRSRLPDEFEFLFV